MTAALERRREVLALAKEYNFLILEGMDILSSRDLYPPNVKACTQTIRIITFITAIPHGRPRISL